MFKVWGLVRIYLNPNVGALIIRIGFWGHYTIIIIRKSKP